MSHHEHGDPTVHVEPGEDFHDFAGGHGIQIACGLIGEERARFGDDGPCNGDTLLLAAGEFTWGAGEFRRKSHRGERRERLFVADLSRYASVE